MAPWDPLTGMDFLPKPHLNLRSSSFRPFPAPPALHGLGKSLSLQFLKSCQSILQDPQEIKIKLPEMELPKVICVPNSSPNHNKSPQIWQKRQIFYFICCWKITRITISPIKARPQMFKLWNYQREKKIKKKRKNEAGEEISSMDPLPPKQHPKHPPTMPKVKSFSQVQRSSKSS